MDYLISLLPWFFSFLLLGVAVFLGYRLLLPKTVVTDTQAGDWREERARMMAQLAERERQIGDLRQSLDGKSQELLSLHGQVAAARQELLDQQRRLQEATTANADKEKALLREFEQLSRKVLEVQTAKFSELQEKQVGDTLNPLRERIAEFQKSVVELRDKGISQQADLKAQIENLRQTNSLMETEARNLTLALRGQKTQGLWGEVVLERVLESSGLTRDREYRVQASHTQADGTRLQPDVIIDLPEGKHLIVDAKVSLTAFLRLQEAQTPEEETKALREHVASLRAHIDGLRKKDYDAIEGLQSPEFVLLFIPVEPAFTVALRAEPALFDHAFSQRIVLVTPSTLLATLKTVASIWRLENQNTNALEIARLGAELYDKLANFCEDLQEVGQRLEQARVAHENATRKLSTGRGNAIRTIERMKDLGLKTRKTIDSKITDRALADAGEE